MKSFTEALKDLNLIGKSVLSKRQKRYDDFRNFLIEVITILEPSLAKMMNSQLKLSDIAVGGKNPDATLVMDASEVFWFDNEHKQNPKLLMHDIDTIKTVFGMKFANVLSKSGMINEAADNRKILDLVNSLKDGK